MDYLLILIVLASIIVPLFTKKKEEKAKTAFPRIDLDFPNMAACMNEPEAGEKEMQAAGKRETEKVEDGRIQHKSDPAFEIVNKAEKNEESESDIDPVKMIVYSEILKPKFDEY